MKRFHEWCRINHPEMKFYKENDWDDMIGNTSRPAVQAAPRPSVPFQPPAQNNAQGSNNIMSTNNLNICHDVEETGQRYAGSMDPQWMQVYNKFAQLWSQRPTPQAVQMGLALHQAGESHDMSVLQPYL